MAEIICETCGVCLENRYAVVREYINKDGDNSVFSEGHFVLDKAGDMFFEPDISISLSHGRFDLLDDSDTCANCCSKI